MMSFESNNTPFYDPALSPDIHRPVMIAGCLEKILEHARTTGPDLERIDFLQRLAQEEGTLDMGREAATGVMTLPCPRYTCDRTREAMVLDNGGIRTMDNQNQLGKCASSQEPIFLDQRPLA